MDYEKKYKEALERAMFVKENTDSIGAKDVSDVIEYIFPELKESEGKKIKKRILLSLEKDLMATKNSGCNTKDLEECITWLEKQGEKSTDEMIEALRTEYEKGRADAITEIQGKQKPLVIDEGKAEMDYCFTKMMNGEKVSSAWSEEDEKIYQSIMDDTVQENQLNGKQTDWLRSIKYRYFPQPKQEWSEEDEAGLGDALWAIQRTRAIVKDENDMGNLWYAENWLKSLKDRYTWKPSDEQMAALNDINVTGCLTYAGQGQELINLYNELKKLREE